MRAHLYDDGGGIVTGTDDIGAARLAIRAAWLERQGLDSEDQMADDDRAGWDFWAIEPVVEVGRIVPAGRYSDYGWFWRPAPTRYRGATTAVVWNPGQMSLRDRAMEASR